MPLTSPGRTIDNPYHASYKGMTCEKYRAGITGLTLSLKRCHKGNGGTAVKRDSSYPFIALIPHQDKGEFRVVGHDHFQRNDPDYVPPASPPGVRNSESDQELY
jgi:hypothetical protein